MASLDLRAKDFAVSSSDAAWNIPLMIRCWFFMPISPSSTLARAASLSVIFSARETRINKVFFLSVRDLTAFS
jgi:hypothetical protein